MRADLIQWPPVNRITIAIDQKVIADVLPAAILDMPAFDLGHLVSR
jgi:hypothetical protein